MRLGLLLLVTLALAGEPVVQMHVKIPMRDGVKLCANIYRPAGGGRVPAVVQRTPYGKVNELTPGLQAFVNHGYAVVTQDVRGRYDSEGEFDQFDQEARDGEDTLNWIVKQAWSDGRIGMFGGSYVGLAQWRVALTGHPALKAIAPAVSGGDEYYDRYYSRGGAFRLAHRARWIAENFKPKLTRVTDFDKMATYLPLRRMDKFTTTQRLDFYQAAMDHPSYDGYWRELSTLLHLDRSHVPAMIEAGWYDGFAETDLEMWQALRAKERPARIVVGPWGHNMSPEMPGADFGPEAKAALRGMEIEWFDAFVKEAVAAPASTVKYFVMGSNEWKESEVWPPEHSAATAFYLSSKKGAQSLNGDGRLGERAPAKAGENVFFYDPAKAVPTVGGVVCCNLKILPWGPADQRRVEGRRDVLVYTGDVLKSELEIAGPVKAVLWVSTSAPDTDFTAKLVDVDPSGVARILTDGILRLRYRHGTDRVASYTPGAVERIEIPAGVTAHTFLPGHRVRLEVASSNFPKYDRNLNTGRAAADEKSWKTARQVVYHGREHASQLILQVVH